MIKLTALTLAGLMTLGVAHADHHGDKKGPKMDLNGDGFITKSEMMKAHEKRVNEHFTEMDANNDGKISKKELRAGKKDMRKKMKERMEKGKERRSERKSSE